jgi:hypothetical protein
MKNEERGMRKDKILATVREDFGKSRERGTGEDLATVKYFYKWRI